MSGVFPHANFGIPKGASVRWQKSDRGDGVLKYIYNDQKRPRDNFMIFYFLFVKMNT